MENIKNTGIITLSDVELMQINAGGIFKDLGIAVGYVLGRFVSSQAREFNDKIGGPTAIHS